MWRPHRWGSGCFPGDTCVLMFILGSNVTLYEAKQKPVCTGLDSACAQTRNVSMCICTTVTGVCVDMLWAWVCVCKLWQKLHMWECVCFRVFAAVSGDICCVVGWERSCRRLQEPQTKEMKAEVTTWTSGTRHTLAHATHKYKVTHANIKTHTQAMGTWIVHTHTVSICLSKTHTQHGEGDTRTQGQETK